jgi:hypothetical protein
MEVVEASLAIIGGSAIGLFLAHAHRDRAASPRRAYEEEMAEHREFYVALAAARRLRSRCQSEDEDALGEITSVELSLDPSNSRSSRTCI